jgi:hypothetical protein
MPFLVGVGIVLLSLILVQFMRVPTTSKPSTHELSL